LKASFGDCWTSLEGNTATALLRPRDLSHFVRNRPNIVAVSSHLLRPPAPADLNVLPVVLIRQPLDRAFSVYSQLRKNHAGELPSEMVARRSSFAEFVLWCLDNKFLGGMVIADYQVIHLSPASFRHAHIYSATFTEEDLLYAMGYLSSGPCFGTVDRFDAVIDQLKRMAEEIGLQFFLSPVTENVTNGRANDLNERVSLAQWELGPSLNDRFEKENRLDYRLYGWACRQ
jgi:hypothetical protein